VFKTLYQSSELPTLSSFAKSGQAGSFNSKPNNIHANTHSGVAKNFVGLTDDTKIPEFNNGWLGQLMDNRTGLGRGCKRIILS
jgi:hypothetical protein